MFSILPIFYETEFNPRLIKLMAKWYFRNIGIKSYTFNNLVYSTKMIDISNKVLADKTYDYYNGLQHLFIKEMDENINHNNYTNKLQSMTFPGYKSTIATHLLMFYETCKSNDNATVPLDYTIEHIIPQSKINTLLTNKDRMHNLGNLTLLEGTNSKNGHKGNSSIGNKPYEDKVSSYKNSTSLITKDIARKYEVFNEETILDRCKFLAKELNNYLSYKIE